MRNDLAKVENQALSGYCLDHGRGRGGGGGIVGWAKMKS